MRRRMMKYRSITGSVIITAVLMVTACISSIVAVENGGTIKLGYVLADETGSLAVNQSTFNTYEGAALSFENLRYNFNNGMYLSANLRNVTLNNRNLMLRLNKPGLFSLSAYNNQYRRTYNSEGFNFTRRRTTGGTLWIRPSRFFKLFSGFAVTKKKGTSFSVQPDRFDTLLHRSDYSQTSFNVGLSGFSRHGSARIEYRRLDINDNALTGGDREANSIRMSASFRPARYDWLELSGGYYYRQDELPSSAIELKTNQGWAGTRLSLPARIAVDYRFSFAQTENSNTGRTTDNIYNTISIGKSWRGRTGIRVGYENRESEDEIDRTVSNGFMASGWFKIPNRLVLRASYGTRDDDVTNGSTLTGDRSVTRHRLAATYHHLSWASLSGEWQNRVTEHEADLALRNTLSPSTDIGSRVDYNRWNTRLRLEPPKYGRFVLSYSYYLGQFENNSDDTRYQFSDHLFRAELSPPSYRGLEMSIRTSYYITRRDHDIEKADFGFAGSYALGQGYKLEVKYDLINFDDFLFTDRYYIGNIVQVSLGKEL